jgi:hypothetical protein
MTSAASSTHNAAHRPRPAAGTTATHHRRARRGTAVAPRASRVTNNRTTPEHDGGNHQARRRQLIEPGSSRCCAAGLSGRLVKAAERRVRQTPENRQAPRRRTRGGRAQSRRHRSDGTSRFEPGPAASKPAFLERSARGVHKRPRIRDMSWRLPHRDPRGPSGPLTHTGIRIANSVVVPSLPRYLRGRRRTAAAGLTRG